MGYYVGQAADRVQYKYPYWLHSYRPVAQIPYFKLLTSLNMISNQLIEYLYQNIFIKDCSMIHKLRIDIKHHQIPFFIISSSFYQDISSDITLSLFLDYSERRLANIAYFKASEVVLFWTSIETNAPVNVSPAPVDFTIF